MEAQRSLMRIKMKYQWLFIEMFQPRFTIYKCSQETAQQKKADEEDDFQVDSNSDEDDLTPATQFKQEDLSDYVRTKYLVEMAKSDLKNWERVALDQIKFDYSKYIFA